MIQDNPVYGEPIQKIVEKILSTPKKSAERARFLVKPQR